MNKPYIITEEQFKNETYNEERFSKPEHLSVVTSPVSVCFDMQTYCKNKATAIRRFRAEIEKINAETRGDALAWLDMPVGMYYEGHDGWTDARGVSHSFSLGIEELDDGLWYIWMNLSGKFFKSEIEDIEPEELEQAKATHDQLADLSREVRNVTDRPAIDEAKLDTLIAKIAPIKTRYDALLKRIEAAGLLEMFNRMISKSVAPLQQGRRRSPDASFFRPAPSAAQ